MMSYIQVRLKRHVSFVFVGGRRLSRHGQFGNIHMVPSADALELIERGEAKLPSHMSMFMLRDRVAVEDAACA